MKADLVRFGVAMDADLLASLDALVKVRGGTRSKVLNDLARAEVMRSSLAAGASAVGAMTLVYNHHARELSERLTDMQHELGEKIRASMHVHLNHDYCLEIIVVKGPSDELRRAAARFLAMRGVKHVGIELVTDASYVDAAGQTHGHGHDEHHDHHHEHGRAKAKIKVKVGVSGPSNRPRAPPKRKKSAS
ncbi:MAG TPA: nickel-responsive transcriptional regulator NikR [Polyangiaceae bacterium]|nr:nickel-responsive transcriptional regulator NikR [Polyangiaceae bacterium]